jgi:hypothetical protein
MMLRASTAATLLLSFAAITGCSHPDEAANGEGGTLTFARAEEDADLAVGEPVEVTARLSGSTPWHCTHSTPCGAEGGDAEIASAACDDAACSVEKKGGDRLAITPLRAGQIRLRVTMAGGASDARVFEARVIDEVRIASRELEATGVLSGRATFLEDTRVAFEARAYGGGRPLVARRGVVRWASGALAPCEEAKCVADDRPMAGETWAPSRTYGAFVRPGDDTLEVHIGSAVGKLVLEGARADAVATTALERAGSAPSPSADIRFPSGESSGLYRPVHTLKDGRRAWGSVVSVTVSDMPVSAVRQGQGHFSLSAAQPTKGTVTVECPRALRVSVPVEVVARSSGS